jgi:hypothetical protein
MDKKVIRYIIIKFINSDNVVSLSKVYSSKKEAEKKAEKMRYYIGGYYVVYKLKEI